LSLKIIGEAEFGEQESALVQQTQEALQEKDFAIKNLLHHRLHKADE
jgi:hypothetical protein